MIEKVSKNELSRIYGANNVNWGSVAGSCGKGAVMGIYFGNPILGCANGAATSLVLQTASGIYKNYQKKR